jgi:hypothetical protein
MDYRKFFSDIINTQTVDYTPFDESVKSNIYFQAVLEKIIALPNSYFYISLDPVLFSISHVSNNAVDADTVSPDTFTHIATIIEDEEETFWKKNHLEDAPKKTRKMKKTRARKATRKATRMLARTVTRKMKTPRAKMMSRAKMKVTRATPRKAMRMKIIIVLVADTIQQLRKMMWFQILKHFNQYKH